MDKFKENLTVICKESTSGNPVEFRPMPGAGGDRRYCRIVLDSGRTVIGVEADDIRESQAFVELSGIFLRHDVRVPIVYGYSDDYRYYVEEDLGDRSLFSELDSPESGAVVEETLRMLVRMQTIPESEWRDAVAFAPMSERLVKWDLNYFKYEFLKPAGINFSEADLEDDMERLCADILSIPESCCGFMMRDCQSRNVMLHPDPCFIDFQGGRKGPCLYDAISFLWQARAGFDDAFRDRMLSLYADNFASSRGISRELVLSAAPVLKLFRTLQVLGAYGFRGLVEKRAHFIESIPGALANLRTLLDEGVADTYPTLKKICRQLTELPRFSPEPYTGRLHVKVFSFSYKKGYPEDLTGNGGGFMFDCRGMHNPGRYDEYKQLTGRDAPVIAFLRERGEADLFADRALEIVSPSVERYMQRGFRSLQIGFGCTGGQHRSVYCAERTAHALARRFPDAIVELIHREQKIDEIL